MINQLQLSIAKMLEFRAFYFHIQKPAVLIKFAQSRQVGLFHFRFIRTEPRGDPPGLFLLHDLGQFPCIIMVGIFPGRENIRCYPFAEAVICNKPAIETDLLHSQLFAFTHF